MLNKSATTIAIFSILLAGCASPPKVRYPIIGGEQVKIPLPNHTPVVIADICPNAYAKSPAAGIYSSTKYSNNQLVWKWICSDLPSAIQNSGVGRVTLSTETIPFDTYDQLLSTGVVDEVTLARINSSQTNRSRYIVFVKLDGGAYTERYYNSAHYTASTFIYDNEVKKIIFSYKNANGISALAKEDNKKIYASLLDKALQITLGDIKLILPNPAMAEQK